MKPIDPDPNVTPQRRAGSETAGSRPEHKGRKRRVLMYRIPLWVVILVLVIGGAAATWGLVSRDAGIEMKPVVSGARKVELRVEVCRDEAQARDLNPTKWEKTLTAELERAGASDVNVEIDRPTCGND